MAEQFDINRVNQFVLAKQHLVGGTDNAPLAQVVQDTCGLHASSPITPYLSLAARLPEFHPKELDHFLYDEPEMARIRCVRKTIYILNQQLIPIFHAATTGKVMKASEHYMIYRGVPLQEFKVLSNSILKLLESEPMTALEIKEALATDFDISAVLQYMCDQGQLVRGQPKAGWKDRRYRYTIFEEVFPDIDLGMFDEREAMSMIVRHYLRAFGPASMDDVIWWTGLGKIRVRSALRNLENEVVEIRLAETNAPLLILENELEQLSATTPSGQSIVKILPNLDSYLMGYIDRDRYVNKEYYQFVFDNSGNATNVVMVNGRVAGVWDYSDKEEATVKLFLFDYQMDATGDVVRSRARRMGQLILEQETRIRQCEKMIPLGEQPAGAFMSPLKNM